MSTIISTNIVSNRSFLANDPMLTDAFGRLRVSEPLTLFDSSHRFSDNGLWNTFTASGGLASFNANEGSVDLIVNTTSGSEVIRETKKVFAYQPGKSLLLLNTFVFAPEQEKLRQRVGYFGTDNGIYFQLESQPRAVLSFVERSSVSGSVVENQISQQGGFYGPTDTGWNVDKLDGSGPSGIVLDPTKAQIMFTDIEWLGVGTVRVGFIIDGAYIICHKFHHANLISSTYITTACLPLRYEITNTGITPVDSTLKQICSSVISEGGYDLRGEAYSIATGITAPYNMTVAGTYYPLISIRLKSSNLEGIVIPTGLNCLPITTGTYEWRLIETGTTTGGSWVSAGASSVIEYNITGTSFTGGTVVHSGFFNASNQGTTMSGLDRAGLFDHQLTRNSFTGITNELTLCVAANTIGGGGSNILANMDWEEITR